MNIHDATETAYRNGYEQGKKDAVKHGKWIQKNNNTKNIYYCSECDRHIECRFSNPETIFPYCHCGAKMDGEDEVTKMNIKKAIKIINDVIPPSDNPMVDISHYSIARAWEVIKEYINLKEEELK